MRTLLAVLGALLFVASGAALRVAFPRRAEAASPPPVAVVDASMFSPRTLLVNDPGDGQPLGIEPTAALPAISADDSEIVTFRRDSEILTLRFFSARSGKILASYELASPDLSRATLNVRVEAAKARLERTRWRALQRGSIIGGRYEDLSMHFPRQGTTVRVKATARDQLRFEGALWQERRVVLPPMGFLKFRQHIPCGAVEGFADAYLDPALGALLLEPDATLGGDECVAQRGIDRLFVVPLR